MREKTSDIRKRGNRYPETMNKVTFTEVKGLTQERFKKKKKSHECVSRINNKEHWGKAVPLASIYGVLMGEGDWGKRQYQSARVQALDRTTASWGLGSGEVERHDITNSLHTI